MTPEARETVFPTLGVGDALESLPTPALVVDVDALECNLDRMSHLAGTSGRRLRPHAKAHKSPDIAAMQITRGAVGICCQTVAEAEAFVAAGVTDVLLTNQIVDRGRAERLARLARKATIGTCADSLYHLDLMARAARSHQVRVDTYVEVDVGGGRCGAVLPNDAVELARAIGARSDLRFAGLQAYNGRAQHIGNHAERTVALFETAAKTREFVDALLHSGLPCPRVTGGGSGSAEVDVNIGAIDELQCGSYAVMDVDYLSLTRASGESLATLFAPALFVIASVISVGGPHRIVIDAGLKAMSFDSGRPLVRDNLNLKYQSASDEHGVLIAVNGCDIPPLSSRMHLIPGHCDPTVALHDHIYAVRAGCIEARWPVVGRGRW